MHYLVDTNVLLWFIMGDERISSDVVEIFHNEQSNLLVSVASIWEISIKYSLKKIELRPDLETFIDKYIIKQHYEILPVKMEHMVYLSKLPFHHRDPFDRMIISQSIVEDLRLLYTDKVFDLYINQSSDTSI